MLDTLSAEEIRTIRQKTREGMTEAEILDWIEAGREAAMRDNTNPWSNGADYDAGIYDGYVDSKGEIHYYDAEKNVWTADTGLIEPCALAQEVDIFLPRAVWLQIVAMTRNTKTEWLGYLDYEEGEGVITATALTIPKQKATSVEVEPLEPQVGKGVIHAHPGDGTPSFSGTDDKTLNPNNEFSIVISRGLQMTAVAKRKLPCGAISLVPAAVTVEGPEQDMEFYEQNKSKIDDDSQSSQRQNAFAMGQAARYARGP